MLRWLKERKKGKKGENGKDEYGFRSKNTEYGFDDKTYHIYEEIPDIPDVEKTAGPYMVVPLDIGDKKQSGKRVSFQIEEDSADSGLGKQQKQPCFDLVESVQSSSRGKLSTRVSRTVPVMGIGQKSSKKSEVVCAIVHRSDSKAPALPARNYVKKSSLSSNSMENMSESKLKSRRLLENILSDLSKSSDDIFKDDASADTKLSTSSSNSVDDLCEKRKNNMSMDSNDTGCECDMNSSDNSDKNSQDSYEYYLHQVEQNFIMRCRVNEMVKDSSTITQRRVDTNFDEESDSDSLTTISTISQATVYPRKPRQSPECESDEGTMADLSESENSSGYYDSCSSDKKDSKPVIRLTSAILQNTSTSSQRPRSYRHKAPKPKERKIPPQRKHTNILEEICEKYESMSETSSNDIYSRNAPSEVYSPPPMRSEIQTVRKTVACSARVGDEGPRYQSVGSSSSNNNRLLSDLIMMNYNKQVFHHV